MLSADLTVPANFNLYVDQGTLTIPNGVTLTIAPEGFFGSRTNTVIQSGGKIVNNSTINSFMGGSITIEKGGTLENNWSIIVFYGGASTTTVRMRPVREAICRLISTNAIWKPA